MAIVQVRTIKDYRYPYRVRSIKAKEHFINDYTSQEKNRRDQPDFRRNYGIQQRLEKNWSLLGKM